MDNPNVKRYKRKISYHKDIIDDVYEYFDGKYSKDKISSVLECSLAYINYLMRFRSCVLIALPHMGSLCCNVHYVKARLKMYHNKKYMSYYDYLEYQCLREKYDKIKKQRKKYPYLKGVTIFRNIYGFLKKKLIGRMDEIRDIMDDIFIGKI